MGDPGWKDQIRDTNYPKYQIRIVGHTGAVAGLYVVKDSVPVTGERATVSFTVPDSAPVALYGCGGTSTFPIMADSAQLQFCYSYWNGGQYVLSSILQAATPLGTTVRRGSLAARVRSPGRACGRSAGTVDTAPLTGVVSRCGTRTHQGFRWNSPLHMVLQSAVVMRGAARSCSVPQPAFEPLLVLST